MLQPGQITKTNSFLELLLHELKRYFQKVKNIMPKLYHEIEDMLKIRFKS